MPFSAYGIERGSPYEPGYRDLVQDIVAAADPKVDFSEYDLVNVLVTPNAGPSALDTVLSVTFSGNADAPLADGVPLANTSFVYSRQDDGSGLVRARPATASCRTRTAMSSACPTSTPWTGGGAVGHWDIMSEDWGANNDLLGWHKWKLGWLDNNQISCASKPGTTRPHPRAAGHPGRSEAGLRAAQRGVGLRGGGTDPGGQRRGGLQARRTHLQGATPTWTPARGRSPSRTAPRTAAAAHGCPMCRPSSPTPRSSPARRSPTPADGIRISVVDKDSKGNYRVRITRS